MFLLLCFMLLSPHNERVVCLYVWCVPRMTINLVLQFLFRTFRHHSSCKHQLNFIYIAKIAFLFPLEPYCVCVCECVCSMFYFTLKQVSSWTYTSSMDENEFVGVNELHYRLRKLILNRPIALSNRIKFRYF